MGIRFTCPNGHKLHVKEFLAGKRGVCPHCGAKFVIPALEDKQQSTSAGAPHDALHGSAQAFGSTSVVAPADIGSQSIIIAVADDRLSSSAPIDANSSVQPAMESPAASRIADATALPQAQSPAWYVSRRERMRRNQLTMAIMLLATVIILALVLILVLRRGSNQPSALELDPNRPADALRWPPAIALIRSNAVSLRVLTQ